MGTLRVHVLGSGLLLAACSVESDDSQLAYKGATEGFSKPPVFSIDPLQDFESCDTRISARVTGLGHVISRSQTQPSRDNDFEVVELELAQRCYTGTFWQDRRHIFATAVACLEELNPEEIEGELELLRDEIGDTQRSLLNRRDVVRAFCGTGEYGHVRFNTYNAETWISEDFARQSCASNYGAFDSFVEAVGRPLSWSVGDSLPGFALDDWRCEHPTLITRNTGSREYTRWLTYGDFLIESDYGDRSAVALGESGTGSVTYVPLFADYQSRFLRGTPQEAFMHVETRRNDFEKHWTGTYHGLAANEVAYYPHSTINVQEHWPQPHTGVLYFRSGLSSDFGVGAVQWKQSELVQPVDPELPTKEDAELQFVAYGMPEFETRKTLAYSAWDDPPSPGPWQITGDCEDAPTIPDLANYLPDDVVKDGALHFSGGLFHRYFFLPDALRLPGGADDTSCPLGLPATNPRFWVNRERNSAPASPSLGSRGTAGQ